MKILIVMECDSVGDVVSNLKLLNSEILDQSRKIPGMDLFDDPLPDQFQIIDTAAYGGYHFIVANDARKVNEPTVVTVNLLETA